VQDIQQKLFESLNKNAVLVHRFFRAANLLDRKSRCERSKRSAKNNREGMSKN